MKTFLKGFALVTGLFTLSMGLYLSAPVYAWSNGLCANTDERRAASF